MRGKLIFYDIEVFRYDALVVFMDIDKNEIAHFWNQRGRRYKEDPSGFEEIAGIIKGNTLVGYNNYFYDDRILTAMMDDLLSLPEYLKALNDRIIAGDNNDKIDSIIYSLDTMQQIDVSRPSLKQIEGNMGSSIVESSVDFNITRSLTDEEREETLMYCRHDVESTVDIYKLRVKSYFEVKESLVAMLDNASEKAYRWNTTTLAANVLLGNNTLPMWMNHHVEDKYWRNCEGIPSEVWDMWESLCQSPFEKIPSKSKTIKAYGCNFVFGLGGLHGAPSKPIRCGKVKHKDVASMYPSAIVHFNALEDATSVYDGMRKERIAIKKTDPIKAGAYKIILNSVYGNFKNEYSPLLNRMASNTICIYGQIALFSLCRELHNAGYQVINANTDGVVYIDDPRLNGQDEVISSEWEKEFECYKLDTDYFDKWIQRDVNNYIAVEPDGRITVKGGDVNKYQENKYFSNNSTRIVQIALVDFLVDGKLPLNTMQDNLDKPILWQYVLKAGNTYLGVQDAAGNWQNKVNRVFAAAPGVEYTKLFKIRQDGGQVNFPDVPERMFVWNDSLDKLTDFRERIDQQYYLDLINSKLQGWPRDVY